MLIELLLLLKDIRTYYTRAALLPLHPENRSTGVSSVRGAQTGEGAVTMPERMTDKTQTPTAAEIDAFIGSTSQKRLVLLEEQLATRYDLSRELRFPFGKDYGWGYKFSHKSAHLLYVFFARETLVATLQIGDAQVVKLEAALPGLSPKAQQLWKDRYPCGKQGGWIHYEIEADNDLTDILALIAIRKKPVRT